MNEYAVKMQLEDGQVETVVVACNNVPCAVEKANKELVLKFRKTGWKFISAQLVKKAYDFSQYPRSRREMQLRHSRIR